MARIDETSRNLAVVDWVIIAAYFVLCLGVGLFSKFRKQRGEAETAEGYFLAGRKMLWWAVGPSLFASNMGSEHFIGLAGSGASTGIAVVSYEWQAVWVLLLLGWVFVPIYLRSRVFTMPEYLNKRFQSRSVRTYLTIAALLSYVFTKTSVDIYAGSLFLYEAVGWNIYVSAAVILVITAVYTLLGGLMAVIFTDVLQCAIMIIGAVVLSILSFIKVGGHDGLWSKYDSALGTPWKAPVANASNASVMATVALNGSNVTQGCYKMTPYWGNMFRPLDDPDYPWLGLWTILPIMGVWYWCTDQVIVQRALGAKNNLHAKAGTIFAGLLKILPLFIMVMPGMISRVLFPDSIACADGPSCLHYCDNKWGCTNNAYPKLVLNVLPTGLVGLMMAVMMAALMSSLSSAFNSSATIFTVDVWLLLRQSASEREKLIVGRVIVAVLVGVSLCWLPIIQGSAGSELFVYIQTIQSYLAPPITMVFGLGILWPGLTEAGALCGLIVGLFLGLLKFIFGNVYPKPNCGLIDDRPDFVKLHFMWYGLIIFGVCGIVSVGVSLFTSKVPREELGGLTWPTINDPPISHGAIGEKGSSLHSGGNKYELPQITKSASNGVEMGRHNPTIDTKDEVEVRPTFKGHLEGQNFQMKEYLDVVPFAKESALTKWGLRCFSVCTLGALIFLWIYYR
ncbi:sodium/glucose cotransporter 5-like [Actinia tenebrosa]|uniref:Sodium/glucose cotransporter 5-like n=1 Tax=Actinia tenebrosa TaxID=6105 RepID=A0A6P8IH14_ACTTE|nr:sodium/glucose cotransporter 5-like [Actinia tenebrosa]